MPGSATHRVLRVGMLGLSLEANTFAGPLLDATDIARFGPLVGEEIITAFCGGSATMSGFLDVAAPDIELVPLHMLTCVPGPAMAAAPFHEQAQALCDALAAQGPFDVVLAALHGACVAEGIPDADGYLLRRFREVIGPRVVLAAALDLHANVSDAMLEAADLINSYQTNPHVDARPQARHLAQIALAAARGQVSPTMAAAVIPAVPSILRQNTGSEPMSSIMAAAAAAQRADRVLSAVVTQGFPYADVPEMGMRAIVITDADPEAAQDHADALARTVWDRRELLSGTAPTADEVMAALPPRSPQGPTLLLDVGDNIGGGSSGDSVVLLHAARRHQVSRLAAIVCDPAAVARCSALEPGAAAEVSFGGWSDPAVGPPVAAQVTVLAQHEGKFTTTGPVHAGYDTHDAGLSVLVRLDTGQLVLLTTNAVMPVHPVQLQLVGVNFDDLDVVIAKGVHSPVAGYGPMTGDRVLVDTPGVTAAGLQGLAYRHRRRPMLPFEPQATLPGLAPAVDLDPAR